MKKSILFLFIVCAAVMICLQPVAAGATYNPAGTLQVFSNPGNASVYLDGTLKGVTPLTLTNVTQGVHAVKIQNTGYLNWETSAYVQNGAITTLVATLVPGVAPTPTTIPTVVPTTVTPTPTVTVTTTPTATLTYSPSGSMQVFSNPTGARVYLDSVYKDITPCTLTGIPQGNHLVEVEKDGYYPYSAQAWVQIGATTIVFPTLVPIDGYVPTPTPTPTATVTTTPTATTGVPQYGGLYVESDPAGALIYIDTVYRGISPGMISDLTVGWHQVLLKKTGYNNWNGQAYIWPGQTTILHPDLSSFSNNSTSTPTPTMTVTTTPTATSALSGTLKVFSNPTGATVFLDGVQKDITPFTLTGVTQGMHSLRLEKEGYYPWTGQVWVQTGAITTVFPALVKTTVITPTGTPTTKPTTTTPTPTLTPPVYGNLVIITNPTGATLSLDGVQEGISPLSFQGIAAGNHTVKAEKSGYTSWTGTTTVKSGDTTTLNVTLISPNATPTLTIPTTSPTTSPTTTSATPTPTQTLVPTGILRIVSNPFGASVFLDNLYEGTSPLFISPVPAGNHTVILAADGYENSTSKIVIQQGKTLNLNINMVPLL
jgi:hypothetical protein